MSSETCHAEKFNKVGRWKRGAYWVNKCTQVQADRVECYHAHGLQWVAVNNVACDDGVAHLDACGKEEKCHLANHPVIGLIDADTPYNQTN